MAAILMHVNNPKKALELLLYVYQNQMHLGKEYLSFTLKHDDGYIERSKGDINHVFKSEVIKEIEIEDLILLEHFINHNPSNESKVLYGVSCDSIDSIINATININRSCSFLFPPNNNVVFFAIKDHPMARYTINNNEVISDLTYGKKSSVINNMCGRLDTRKGLVLMKSIFK